VNSDNTRKPVVDASAAHALLQREPGPNQLRDLQTDAVVNAAEVVAKLVARGMPTDEAQAAFEILLVAVSARYVHKGVSLGDRCFLAAVHQHGSGWTSDHDLGTIFGGRVPTLRFFR
jgi:PIN domain nuclease of toxin-antitoxin system